MSDILRQDRIKPENLFMLLSESSWKECPDIDRITVSYIVLYQGEPIYNWIHVTVLVAQSSSDI